MRKLKGIFILDEKTFDLVYGPDQRDQISQLVELIAPLQNRSSIMENSHLLKHVEVIFSGWTPPDFNESFFDLCPKLKAIFYAAGKLGCSKLAARRGVQVSHAHYANSRPVAEYSLAMIILSLKQSWRLMRETRQQQTFVERNDVPGCYRSTVGLVSVGLISKILITLLKNFEVDIIVYDPYLSDQKADLLGVRKVSLESIFAESDVISLHTPVTNETVGMITKKHLGLMKKGVTLINTARGAIVCESDLIETAQRRNDLHFVLDVTDPIEPPAKDSLLYRLPNISLTPHLAGSAGMECRRLGQFMADELKRFVMGRPLLWSAHYEDLYDNNRLAEIEKPELKLTLGGRINQLDLTTNTTR